LFLGVLADKCLGDPMFEWKKFWKAHPRRRRIQQKPRLLGNLKGFGRALWKARPKKNPYWYDPRTFPGAVSVGSWFLLLLVCWKLVDLVFPTHWIIGLTIATVLAVFCMQVWDRFRQP
jgi:hypothetical protein